jgi:branched-chain amino acid transport system ATP-binding protein
MPLLTVDDLHVAYGNVHAVRGVGFEVVEGEVLGVIGANGAGKSSLLKAVTGAVPALQGRVTLEGRELAGTSVAARVRAGLALSPEGRGVLPGLSVAKNLELGYYATRGIGRREKTRRLTEAFELFPILGERRDQPAQTLSGGEAAMLSVARALMAKPRVVFLDEPTLGLAPVVSSRLFEHIAALRSAGLTMVIVEQRATELFEVADRVLQMRQGAVQSIARVDELDAAALSRLYFGDEQGGEEHVGDAAEESPSRA